MAIWAIVPMKPLARAKARLASVLDADARASLVRAMAGDVWAALRASEAFDRVLVVTADELIAADALVAGCSVLRDESDLNGAYRAGFAHATANGATRCVFLPGDAPLIDAGSLRALMADVDTAFVHEGDDLVALVGCKTGDGTNLLACSTARDAPELSYGAGSFLAHQALQGRATRVLRDTGVALDIDTPEDLARLRSALLRDLRNAPRTRGWFAAQEGARLALKRYERDDARALLDAPDAELMASARWLRDAGFGAHATYSKKVFLPLTHLCRDTCRYCVFAQTPRQLGGKLFMEVDEAVAVAAEGAKLGCKEALLTLGERPELRYAAAREWLDARGYKTTLDYVAHVAREVLKRTGLLPHINAGAMEPEEIAALRKVSASMGAMVENLSPRLSERGQAHHGAPDKTPDVLLRLLDDVGAACVPFTTGVLIGIGETREERIDTLFAIREAHEKHGHIQEVIVQNFAPKPGTKMSEAPAADHDDLAWTIAVARLILGAEMSIQAPPNLSDGKLKLLIDAGINDWGGVSPLTPDFVNPEMPWPSLEKLRSETEAAGEILSERLTIYPPYSAQPESWLDKAMRTPVLQLSDARGFGREDAWVTGRSTETPTQHAPRRVAGAMIDGRLREILDEVSAGRGDALGADEIAHLFTAESNDYHLVCEAADDIRQRVNGDVATYVVNRNINYTNICTYHCAFCGFSKGDRKHAGGEKAYLLDSAEISRRTAEAYSVGATEVCLQGGIHPSFTGETYLEICRAVLAGEPSMHIHAFSPLEVTHGAQTLGLDLATYLTMLKDAGLSSLPGTAAEILHDPIRDIICPDKLRSEEWLNVIETAHRVGLRTTSTIMFGHVEGYRDWAVHLTALRDLQKRTGGFTEFVPLAFVAHEAPMYRKGQARPGPTFREAVLMHAVSRLTLHPHFENVQTSWVKMGPEGMKACLKAGANDLGGVLMDESITRAAGATHGLDMSPAEMQQIADALGWRLRRRNTLYGDAVERVPYVSLHAAAY